MAISYAQLFEKLINLPKPDPVVAYTERIYETPAEIRDAIEKLAEIGSESAAEAIVIIMKAPELWNGGHIHPLLRSDLMKLAIEALEGLPQGAREIGELIAYERRAPNRPATIQTHEREAMSALHRIGGGEAMDALRHVAVHYPEITRHALVSVANNDTAPAPE